MNSYAIGAMNWVETPLSLFESDWMALHRFLWLNALDGTALWKILVARSPGRVRPVDKPQDFGSEMQRWSATAQAGRSIAAKAAAAVLGDNARWIARFDSIRFCPACLAGAFHSHIFQITALDSCPVHGHLLVDHCQHCGVPLRGPLLRPTSFLRPLCCGHCGISFGGGEQALVTAEQETPAAQIFSELTRDIVNALKCQVRGTGLLDPEARLPGFAKAFCQCALDAVGGRGSSAAVFGESVVTACDAGPLVAAADSWSELNFGDQVLFDEKTLKAIDELLAKAIRDICGHASPAPLAINAERGNYSELKHVLVMQPGDCPCCATLSWWRAEVSKILALSKRVAHLQAQGYMVADREGYFMRELSLHPSVFKLAATSTFSRMAVAIAESCSPSSGRDPFADGLDSGDTRQAHGVRYLPIERHFLEPSTLEFDVDGRRAAYTCSLEASVAHLQRASARAKATASRFRATVTADVGGSQDPWYLKLGEYSSQSWRSPENLVLRRRA